jgi:hypothetical protein
MITIATVLNHRPPHEGHGFSRATGENPRPILKPSFSAASEVGGWQEIKVNSGELNHREVYLYLRYRKLAPVLKQRTYQPQGWPTLIFENSIVGLSSPLYPHETWNWEAAAAFPRPKNNCQTELIR